MENGNKIKVMLKKQQNAIDLPVPQYMSENSAGMDLYANIADSVILKPMERKLISTGISISLPEGYEAQVRSRSGLALKKGLAVLNSPGTVDSDYRGVVSVILINFGEEPVTINRGDRIAQLVVNRYQKVFFEVVESLDETGRAEGGFGHTGVSVEKDIIHPSKKIDPVVLKGIKLSSQTKKIFVLDGIEKNDENSNSTLKNNEEGVKQNSEKIVKPEERTLSIKSGVKKELKDSPFSFLSKRVIEKPKESFGKNEDDGLEELVQGMKKLKPEEIQKKKSKTNVDKRLIQKIIKLDNCYDENIKKIDKMFGIEIL